MAGSAHSQADPRGIRGQVYRRRSPDSREADLGSVRSTIGRRNGVAPAITLSRNSLDEFGRGPGVAEFDTEVANMAVDGIAFYGEDPVPDARDDVFSVHDRSGIRRP